MKNKMFMKVFVAFVMCCVMVYMGALDKPLCKSGYYDEKSDSCSYKVGIRDEFGSLRFKRVSKW